MAGADSQSCGCLVCCLSGFAEALRQERRTARSTSVRFRFFLLLLVGSGFVVLRFLGGSCVFLLLLLLRVRLFLLLVLRMLFLRLLIGVLGSGSGASTVVAEMGNGASVHIRIGLLRLLIDRREKVGSATRAARTACLFSFVELALGTTARRFGAFVCFATHDEERGDGAVDLSWKE